MDFIDWRRFAHALEVCVPCNSIHLMLFYLSPMGDKVARICCRCYNADLEDYDVVVKRLPKANILRGTK